MLGLELRDNLAVAVGIDEQGSVQARAAVPSNGSLAAAAAAALERVAQPSTAALTTLGIAALAPESPECRDAVDSLAARWAGPFVRDGAMMSGTASAVAEAWVGAARGVRDVVFFAAAEHATGGIVRSGVPVMGAHHRGPAVAWLALNPVEREDYRRAGCLEAEVSAAGLVKRLIWRIKAGDRSRVQDLVGGDLSMITADLVLDAARQNDGVSISVVRDTAKYLGMAAANLVAMADPDTIVLGGIMSSSADLLFEPVRIEIGRRLPPALLQTVAIVPASLGDDAAAIGAARLATAALQ
jgi:predicted NBD/HSP70 family sugar kinase